MRNPMVLPSVALVATLAFGGAATAQDRFVDDNDVTCGGNSPCYSTIAAAIAAVAVDGETIAVAAGTYTENLVINRALNLIGAGSGVTTLKSGNGASEFLILLGANVPITLSQGMEISGFTLQGPLDGDEDLIMFRARSAAANDPIVIRDNVFDCESDHDLKGLESRSGGDLTNVVIEGNTWINECRYAMFLNSAINWLIQGNIVDTTWTGGFVANTSNVDQLHDIDFLDNTIDRACQRPDAPGFLPNQFVTSIGLSSIMYNVEVVGNTITNANCHSITVGDRGNPVLTGMNVSCNNMSNNLGGALNEIPAFVIPSEDNWWGAADGPSGVGPGSGDLITAGFDFDPFLVTPPGPNCPAPPTGACCTDGPGTVTDCIEVTQDECETDGGLFIGLGITCADINDDCDTLLVEFDSLTAHETRDGILIRWTTTVEVDTVGFRLLRENGDREKAMTVIAPMIHASGDALTGASYLFLDNTRGHSIEARYFVEDIGIFGKVTRHGPIEVQPLIHRELRGRAIR